MWNSRIYLKAALVSMSSCLLVFSPRTAHAARFIRGDVDESGFIEMADAIRIFGHLFLGAPAVLNCHDAADSNNDGSINITDGIHLLHYLFTGGAPPPQPFPACGLDSLVGGADGLQCTSHEPCRPPSCSVSVNGKVDVGGFSLFAQSGGIRCPPTVVFDAGLGDTSLTWSPIFAAIVQQAVAVRYDRAWLGSSDPGPEPRTSNHIVTELHTLLTSGGFEPPYVLVGHSLGGLHIRLYAARYPKEVAGLVFVDPAHEHAYTRWAAEFPDVYSGWLAENDARLTSPGASREWSALKQVLPGLGEPGALPDMPVAVLTAGRPVTAGGVFTQEFVEAFPNIWYEAHEMLVQSASRGAHILAEQSSHQIHQDQPQLVIDAIAQVVEAVR